MRRLRLGAGALLFSTLAIVALYFVLGLSEQPSLRWRFDLSEVRRNSLDPSTEALLGKLDEEVIVHTFFRREGRPEDGAAEVARGRVLDLFLVASKLAPTQFKFRIHDLSDIAAAGAEMQRLGTNAVNTIVFEQADRHVVQKLVPDYCELGRDQLDPTRFTVLSFRGEEALVDGLLKVSAENRPRVYFSEGHGELLLDGDGSLEPEGAGLLGRVLSVDGFDVGAWNGALNGPLPETADILAIVGPSDPFSVDEMAMVREFVDRGGRLFVTLGARSFDGPGSPGAILAQFGMLPRPGLVCIPTLSQDFGGTTMGLPACAQFQIEGPGLNSSHPITKPIWELARKVAALSTRSFERGATPAGGSLQDLLVQRNQYTWRDLPGPKGERYDYRLSMGTERIESVSIAMAAEYPVGDADEEARIVGIGAESMASNSLFFANEDFLKNCFNWLADRDFNVRVAFKQNERTVIDVLRGTEIIWLRRVAWYGLPGLLALVGMLLAWRRRT